MKEWAEPVRLRQLIFSYESLCSCRPLPMDPWYLVTSSTGSTKGTRFLIRSKSVSILISRRYCTLVPYGFMHQSLFSLVQTGQSLFSDDRTASREPQRR